MGADSHRRLEDGLNATKDTLNRFKVRGFGSLLEAGTKADTKHDIGPTVSFISSACRRTHCKHIAEDDLEVFSIDDLGLDLIFAHNFLTRHQKLSLYAFGHLEVSELAACLEKATFSNTSGHDKVF
ncbi:hypothetical protein Tco_0793749 [Tanacetum coccineum]